MSNGKSDLSLVSQGSLGEIYELRNQGGMSARIWLLEPPQPPLLPLGLGGVGTS